MPEIDKDLFQGLSLLLLAITAIALLALLATMSRANKLLREQLDRLKESSPGGVAPPVASDGEALESSLLAPAAIDESQSDLGAADQPPGDASAMEESFLTDEPAATSGQPLAGEEASPVPAAGDWGSTPSEPLLAGDESGADAFAGISDTSSEPGSEVAEERSGNPFASDQAVDPFTGEAATVGAPSDQAADPFASDAASTEAPVDDDPFGAQTAAAASQDDDPFGASGATSAAAEQDDEQPFEQGGRWYFRRDGELLVYDESTGEWVDASEEPPSQPAAAPATQSWDDSSAGETSDPSYEAAGTSTDMPEDEGVTEAFDAIERAEQSDPEPAAGGFWKCPSCGAVNGSTASTCRMCFAARP